MKKIGMAFTFLMICFCLFGCGSADRWQEASAQYVSQEAQAAVSEDKDLVEEDLEVMESAGKEQERLIDTESEKAKSAEKEIAAIRNTKKSELISENDLDEVGSLSEERWEQTYKDNNGDLYCYNDAGEVIDFIANVDTANSRAAKAGEEEIKEMADIYLANLVENPSYYQLDRIEYNESVKLYLVVYDHQIDGVDTTDLVLVGLDNELNLTSFSVPRENTFQEMEGIEVDVEKIKQEALDMYYKKNGDSVVDLRIDDFMIGTDDDGKIGYRMGVYGSMQMDDGQNMNIADVMFVPYHK